MVLQFFIKLRFWSSEESYGSGVLHKAKVPEF